MSITLHSTLKNHHLQSLNLVEKTSLFYLYKFEFINQQIKGISHIKFLGITLDENPPFKDTVSLKIPKPC